jgi:hypothetical protein
MTMTRRPPVSVIVLVIVIVILLFVGLLFIPVSKFVDPLLFRADGRNLLNNGSFEAGSGTSTPDERFLGEPSNCKMLCDGSRTIDGWEVSGKGPGPSNTCSNGKVAGDAVCWVINPAQCLPKSPPCPNERGVAAQDGNRFVDLTGFIESCVSNGTDHRVQGNSEA